MTSPPPPASGPPAPKNGPDSGQRSAASGSWTTAELLQWTQSRFAAEGIEDARLDAEYLLAHALNCSRMSLYVEHDRPVDSEQRSRFRELVRRRLAREPVAYIEGKRGFHALGLELAVDPRVLVPRPETEHLVDWVLEDLQGRPFARVLDVGTGSGAIALAVKFGCPAFEVWASDVSDAALAVARDNAARLQLEVHFVHGDLLAAMDSAAGPWTAVAANLPYIPSGELDALSPEVSIHEPRLALDGGPDGLQVIERLLEQIGAGSMLEPGATIYLEVGLGQAPAVAKMLETRGLVAATRNDYAGIARVVRGRKPSAPPPSESDHAQ